MKITKREIKKIIANTPQELKGSQEHYTIEDYGYFTPSNVNWSYRAGFINYNGVKILVVKQFGEILTT